jgi:hypothetical protein
LYSCSFSVRCHIPVQAGLVTQAAAAAILFDNRLRPVGSNQASGLWRERERERERERDAGGIIREREREQNPSLLSVAPHHEVT